MDAVWQTRVQNSNSKVCGNETLAKAETEKLEIRNLKVELHQLSRICSIGISNLGFVSNFEFRTSNLPAGHSESSPNRSESIGCEQSKMVAVGASCSYSRMQHSNKRFICPQN